MSVALNDTNNDDEEEADALETGISWCHVVHLCVQISTVHVQAAVLLIILSDPYIFFLGYFMPFRHSKNNSNTCEVQKCVHAACECLLELQPV